MRNIEAALYSAFDRGNAKPIIDFLRWLASSYYISQAPVILDVGCGPGRLLTEFARLGWKTVGFEPYAPFYAHAQELTHSLPHTSVMHGGFHDLNEYNAFDLIVSVNGPFSYLLTPAQRADALSRMYTALTPRGCLFLDTANFPFILRHYNPPKPAEAIVQGMTIHRAIAHHFDWHHTTLTHIDTFTFHDPERGERTVTQTHRFGLFGFPELECLLEAQGYINIRTYNDYAARTPEPLTGARLMVSAQKPAQ
jgi:SAM-dependent methyltransferase